MFFMILLSSLERTCIHSWNNRSWFMIGTNYFTPEATLHLIDPSTNHLIWTGFVVRLIFSDLLDLVIRRSEIFELQFFCKKVHFLQKWKNDPQDFLPNSTNFVRHLGGLQNTKASSCFSVLWKKIRKSFFLPVFVGICFFASESQWKGRPFVV